MFTVVTFPFLFGVMFGDIGHGFLLFLLGAYLVYSYKYTQKGSLLRLMGTYRYLFLLMGFFATYCGLIYNDFIAIMTTFNSTCYDKDLKIKDAHCVPEFGIDRVWGKAKNKISFLNSFKMKLSIVIGVSHMIMGIALKGFNTLYFKEYTDFIFEFIP